MIPGSNHPKRKRKEMAAIAIATGANNKEPHAPTDGLDDLAAVGATHGNLKGFHNTETHGSGDFQAALATLHKVSTEDMQVLLHGMKTKPLISTGLSVFLCWFVWMFGGAAIFSLINDWSYPQSVCPPPLLGFHVDFSSARMFHVC